jgi:hypothetical protein
MDRGGNKRSHRDRREDHFGVFRNPEGRDLVAVVSMGCGERRWGQGEGVVFESLAQAVAAPQDIAAQQQGTFALAAAVVSSLGAAVASVAALYQIKSMRKGVEIQDQDGRVSVLLDVRSLWTNTLSSLYEVRDPTSGCANAEASFASVTDFMRSTQWQKLRVVCNFYEFVGPLAFNGVLRLETLLVIVTVRASDYQLAKASIDRLRRDYRQDIYLFWDWLDIQCNHARDLPQAMDDKRREMNALAQHWAAKGSQPPSTARGGLNPFDPSAKPGL